MRFEKPLSAGISPRTAKDKRQPLFINMKNLPPGAHEISKAPEAFFNGLVSHREVRCRDREACYRDRILLKISTAYAKMWNRRVCLRQLAVPLQAAWWDWERKMYEERK